MPYKWSFYYQTKEQEVPKHYCWCCQTGAAVTWCEKTHVILNANKANQVSEEKCPILLSTGGEEVKVEIYNQEVGLEIRR